MNKKIIESLKENKKLLVLLSSLIVVSIVVFIIGRTLADPNTGYLRNQTVEGLSFENANLVYENGITTFTVEVYNESGDIYSLKNISINLKAENNDVTTLIGYIGETLEKDEAKYITASIDQDLSSSVNLEYIVNK